MGGGGGGGGEGGRGRIETELKVSWYTWSIGRTQVVVLIPQPVPCVPLNQV